jgi:hypothetical protein
MATNGHPARTTRAATAVGRLAEVEGEVATASSGCAR